MRKKAKASERTFRIIGLSTCAVILVALLASLAIFALSNSRLPWSSEGFLNPVSVAYAADGSDGEQGEDGDEPEESGEPEETPIEKAKHLIEALPADPDEITEAHKPAIDEAQAAYDALSSAEQQELDETELAKEQTYGRWLESAQWGLLAQRSIDNTLDVIDGDYSDYVVSVSSVGKSTSKRSKTWTVVGLKVVSGQVTAVVRCDSQSAFRNMRVGGVDYAANVVDGVPEFTVPVIVNDMTTFTIDANSVADSIAGQLWVTLPLDPAADDEISAAKSKAQAKLSGDLSAYTSESATAIKAAAKALMEAASKAGVTSMELAQVEKAFDDVVANAVKKEKGESGSSAKKKSKSEKKKKSDKSKDSGKSKDSSSSKSSSSASAVASKTATAPTVGRTAVVPTVTKSSVASSSKGSSSSSSSKSSASASAVSTTGQSDVSSRQAIQQATSAAKANNELLTKALVMLLALSLLLVGMCARTVLFMRAKEVA